MRFLTVAFLVAHATLVFSNAIPDSSEENGLEQPTPRVDLLLQLLEDVRAQMPCGWPDSGIPPLAPLLLDHVEQVLGLTGIIDLQFILDSVEVRDLDRFIVKRFELNLWTMRLNFEFTYHRVKILADNYLANGRIVSNPIVNRSGHFEMDLFDVDIVGHAQLGTINFIFLNLQELVTNVSVGNARANIGFLGSRFTNIFLNILLEKQIPAIVDQNAESISNAVSNAALPLANAQLNRMTIADLINLINNSGPGAGGEGEGSCVPSK